MENENRGIREEVTFNTLEEYYLYLAEQKEALEGFIEQGLADNFTFLLLEEFKERMKDVDKRRPKH